MRRTAAPIKILTVVLGALLLGVLVLRLTSGGRTEKEQITAPEAASASEPGESSTPEPTASPEPEETPPPVEEKLPVTIAGQDFPADTALLDLSQISYEKVQPDLEKLGELENLETICLRKTDGTTDYTLDQALELQAAVPDVWIDTSFQLLGETVTTDTQRLEYVKIELGDAGMEEIRAVLPLMKKLTYLKVDRCNVSDDLMIQTRQEYPDIKVVWRVYFTKYSCLTDTKKIWGTGSVTDAYTKTLQYCTDVEYLDMGHNCITNVDFIRYMPKLKVCILAITWVESIEPLANCPELEYLEIFNSRVSDLSPLANCKSLEHLNVSYLADMTDISPLYDLTNLKRLWCTQSQVPVEQQEEIQKLLPDCQFSFSSTEDPSKGAWRFDEEGNKVERYELLCEQFGYDDALYSTTELDDGLLG